MQYISECRRTVSNVGQISNIILDFFVLVFKMIMQKRVDRLDYFVLLKLRFFLWYSLVASNSNLTWLYEATAEFKFLFLYIFIAKTAFPPAYLPLEMKIIKLSM